MGKATKDGSGGGSTEPVDDKPGSKRVCRRTGENRKKIRVPCTSPTGTWNNTYECYVGEAEDPQPPKSDPIWEGNDDGKIYSCYSQWKPGADSPDGPGSFQRVWLRTRPTVDQEELARTAVDRMNLRAIELGLSVPDLPDRMIYVGAPVWLWTADPDAQTLGPNRLSASAGGVTVTADATLQRVTWEMGDGETVRCAGRFRAKGTVYKPAFGLRDSPSCGYRYQHPSKRVTITATSHWVVDRLPLRSRPRDSERAT